MRKIIVYLLVLLWIVGVFSSVAGANSELELDYQLNFDSGTDFSRWNLLTASITNNGVNDWQGTVEVVSTGSFVEDVFVETGKTVDVYFYLPPMSTARFLGGDERVQLQLIGEDGRVSESTRVDTVPSQYSGVIGVVSGSPDDFNRLTNIFSGLHVASLQEEHFNDVVFMDNINMLIISDGQILSLQPRQQENITRWVEGGGILIVGGGRGWQNNMALVSAELVPFQPDGVTEVSGDLPFVQGDAQYLVTRGTVAGEVLLETQSTPLLVSKEFGRGRVFYSTLNLEDAPFNDATAMEQFWEIIYASGGAPQYAAQFGYERWDMPQQLLNMMSMTGQGPFFFAPGWMFFGIIFYILLVGPVSYLVLRRLRRWEWGWLTIPVTAVLFTAIIYMVANSGRATDYALYQYNVIEFQRENRAVAESYGAVFVPRRGSVRFDLPIATVATGQGGVVQRDTETTASIRVDNPPLWSMQRLYATQTLELDGIIELEGIIGDNQVEVTATNTTNDPLFDSYVRWGSGWQAVGSLEPGESKTVMMDRLGPLDLTQLYSRYAQNYGGYGYWPDEMFNYPYELLFIGFNDEMSIIELSDVTETTSLNIIVAGLEMGELSVEENFSIRPGWLKPRIVADINANNRGGNYYGPSHGNELYLNGTGQVDLIFPLPANVDYSQGKYELNFNLNGNGTGEIEVYNGSLGQWEELDSINFSNSGGSSRNFTLDNIGDLVSADRLRVRLKYQGDVWCDVSHIFSVQGGVTQ